MLSKRETKLFPLRSKYFKEDKQPMSLGIDERSQWLRYKSVKDCRPDKEGNDKPTRAGLVWREEYIYEGNAILLVGGLVGKKNDVNHSKLSNKIQITSIHEYEVVWDF